MPTSRAIFAEPKVPSRQVQIIDHDQQVGGQDVVKSEHRVGGFAAEIDEGLRLHEQHPTGWGFPGRNVGLPPALGHQVQALAGNQGIDHRKSEVVPRAVILATRIADAEDHAHGGCIVHLTQHKPALAPWWPRQKGLVMADSYLLLLPTGSEGPYTVEELRDLIRRGKARSGDRLRSAESPAHCLVSELIPDAAVLEKEVPPASERIRRRVSDRHRAVKKATTDRQLSDPEGRAASSATNRAVFTMPPPPPPPLAAAPVSNEQRGQRLKQIISIIVIVISGFVLWQEIKPESYPERPPHPFAGTAWISAQRTAPAALKDLRLVFTADKVAITCGGQTKSYAYKDEYRDTGEQFFALQPAHPVLGASFSLLTNDIPLRLTGASGVTVELNDVMNGP